MSRNARTCGVESKRWHCGSRSVGSGFCGTCAIEGDIDERIAVVVVVVVEGWQEVGGDGKG